MENRDEKILDNMPLVHYMCRKLKCPPHIYEDCIQEGTIGLIDAVDRFDESLGYEFSTFAANCIRNRILIYLRDRSTLIRTPRSLVTLRNNIIKLQNDGLDCSEICKLLNITSLQHEEALHCTNYGSLDVVIDEDTGATPMDFILDNDEEPIEILEEYVMDIVKEIIKDEPQYIKDMYTEYMCSKMWDEPVSQEYLGQKFGKSQPQISRIIRRLDSKLKILYFKR